MDVKQGGLNPHETSYISRIPAIPVSQSCDAADAGFNRRILGLGGALNCQQLGEADAERGRAADSQQIAAGDAIAGIVRSETGNREHELRSEER